MFEETVNKFDKLDIKNKQKNIIDEMKLMIVVMEKICVDNNIKFREVKSKEILALREENISESDYLTALYVYVEYLKEVMGAYFSDMVK